MVDDPVLQEALQNARLLFLGDWSDSELEGLLDVIHHYVAKLKMPAAASERRGYDLSHLIDDHLALGHRGLNRLKEEIGAEHFYAGLAHYAAATNRRDSAISFSNFAHAVALEREAAKWRRDNQQRATNAAEGAKRLRVRYGCARKLCIGRR